MDRTLSLAVSSALALAALACSSSTPEPMAPVSPVPDAAATTTGASPVVLATVAAPTSAAPAVASASAAPVVVASTSSMVPAAPDKPAVLHLTQGKVNTADADLAAADDKVRACLAKSKGAGEVLVKITIATSGFALSATVKPSGDVGKDAVKCARDAMRDHSFGKPVGGGVAAAEGTFKVSGS